MGEGTGGRMGISSARFFIAAIFFRIILRLAGSFGEPIMNWEKLLCTDRLRQTTKQPEELRGEIHRDYGRVVFSTPVRRLQDKAQVFPLETIDAVRTRLTHSLEVSSVARGVAQVASRELVKIDEITPDQAYDIETIAATCGLVHDIGNPPFGHAGEAAIQEWFIRKDSEKRPQKTEGGFWQFDSTQEQKYRSDFELFDGNAQTLRLLATLQILSDRTGLNLTFATLSAALKYTSNSVEVAKDHAAKKKPGFFSSEEWLVNIIREKTGTGQARNPITFLVEASDDMVYSTVDIEDGIKKCVLSWATVREILDAHKSRFGEKLFSDCVIGAEKRIDGAGIRVRNRDEAISQYFRTLAIVKGQDAIRKTFLNNYDKIMNGTYCNELLYDTNVAAEVAEFFKVLKEEINYKYVYTAKETLRLELLGKNVIHFLLDTFYQAERSDKTKTFPQKIYNLLSQNYRTVFESPRQEELVLPDEYRKLLLITDYVCGMTDTFALNLRRELQHG